MENPWKNHWILGCPILGQAPMNHHVGGWLTLENGTKRCATWGHLNGSKWAMNIHNGLAERPFGVKTTGLFRTVAHSRPGVGWDGVITVWVCIGLVWCKVMAKAYCCNCWKLSIGKSVTGIHWQLLLMGQKESVEQDDVLVDNPHPVLAPQLPPWHDPPHPRSKKLTS